jgi:transcriptional regulator with XRE-family HTH domain
MQTDPSTSSPFGVLLRTHRQAIGLTQAELAERAGLSWQGIADLERGARRTPRRDTLARLAVALDLAQEERAELEAAARHSSLPTTLPAPPTVPATGALAGHHHLPIPATQLLGRDWEVAAVSALLRRREVRLVTLTGPGGVGKTRLGLQVAIELAGAFADGAWFVRLSRLTDPALVLPTIAETLGLQEAAGGRQPPHPGSAGRLCADPATPAATGQLRAGGGRGARAG